MINDRTSVFVNRCVTKIALMEQMWRDPRVQLYNDREMPLQATLQYYGSVFLAGPTSRHQLIEYNWRCEAVAFLREAGFQGFIFAPEPRGEEREDDFTERSFIHQWESARLFVASSPVFWIPRKGDELLGLNTNLELGVFIGRVLFSDQPTSVFVGWPDEAERMGLPYHYAVERAGCKRYKTLRELCLAVMGK